MTKVLYVVLLYSMQISYCITSRYLSHLTDPDKNAFGFTEVFSSSAPFLLLLLSGLSPSVILVSYFDLVNLFAESIFDPCMSGDIEEVPDEGLPLSPSIEEPSMPGVAEEEFFWSYSNILVIVVLASGQLLCVYGCYYWV